MGNSAYRHHKRKVLMLHIVLAGKSQGTDYYYIYLQWDQTALQEESHTSIWANSVLEDQAVARAVHRFEPEFLVINLRKEE